MVRSHAAAVPDVVNTNMLATIWTTTSNKGGDIKRIALAFADGWQSPPIRASRTGICFYLFRPDKHPVLINRYYSGSHVMATFFVKPGFGFSAF